MQWTVPAYVEILKSYADQYYSCSKGKRGALLNSVVKKIVESSKEHRSHLPDDLPHVCISCSMSCYGEEYTAFKKITNWYNNHRASKGDAEDTDKRTVTT